MVVMAIFAIIRPSHSFFDYKTDCLDRCQRRILPCTISEYSPTHFPCECITTNEACVEKSGPQLVCLRPGGLSPVGGEDIWIPYWNYTHPKPNPTPSKDGNRFIVIYAAVITTVFVLHWGIILSRCIMSTLRRHHYERLEAGSAPPGGMPDSRPNPYDNPTTQQI